MHGTCSLLLAGVAVAVHPQHVVGDLAVVLGVHLVEHDEEQVEAGQQGVLQADVLHGGLVLVVLHKTRAGEHWNAGGGEEFWADRLLTLP